MSAGVAFSRVKPKEKRVILFLTVHCRDDCFVLRANHHEHIPTLTLKERELERLKKEKERQQGGLTGVCKYNTCTPFPECKLKSADGWQLQYLYHKPPIEREQIKFCSVRERYSLEFSPHRNACLRRTSDL